MRQVEADEVAQETSRYSSTNVEPSVESEAASVDSKTGPTPQTADLSSDTATEDVQVVIQPLNAEHLHDDNHKSLHSNTTAKSSQLDSILLENTQLKEKVSKLKTLLSRSAKASKDTKQELDEHKKLLDQARKEIERLNRRVESLENRPSHLDLLADFDTNFDRALMNFHTEDCDFSTQSGGEPTAPLPIKEDESSFMLVELSQTRTKLEQMEEIYSSLLNRSAELERQNQILENEKIATSLKIDHLQLELSKTRTEKESALHESKEKSMALQEMQMEIDLVTKAAMEANSRANDSLEITKSAMIDKSHIKELEAKIVVLQEWAKASSEAKSLILEQNKVLERKISQLQKQLHNDMLDESLSETISERRLWTKSSSVVIGAGLLAYRHIELGENDLTDIDDVVLKWKFDITPSSQDIYFSVLNGMLDEKQIRDTNASALIKNRLVVGGGGGEIQNPFILQNACTLVFSNEHSWIRPRTVKYEVEAIVLI